jgi:hypothetical protein
VSLFGIATRSETAWAAHVWKRMSFHEKVGLYFATTGFFDVERQRCREDWYEIDPAARREIANTLLRQRAYILEAGIP